MLVWGKLGGMYGHKRLFVCGNAIFALGSAMVGLSPSIGVMIASRALQGIGAAMLNPAAISLIALSFPPKERSCLSHKRHGCQHRSGSGIRRRWCLFRVSRLALGVFCQYPAVHNFCFRCVAFSPVNS